MRKRGEKYANDASWNAKQLANMDQCTESNGSRSGLRFYYWFYVCSWILNQKKRNFEWMR